tara:strand:+ start:250 stop:1704 length:1455 start_codon:yes stop_codon:yes gene_type:complete
VTNIGIKAVGAYVPRRRLSRAAIVEAHFWAKPGLKGLGRGTRAICSHDEDVITMAVEAGRACIDGLHQTQPEKLFLASTGLPFADRQNATLVGEALGLNENIRTADFTGSQRAGTGALLQSLSSASGDCLVIGSEKCLTKPGSIDELIVGDGAASLLVGEDELVANFVGSHSISRDLVDHYRASHSDYDYVLEERWVRDEGTMRIIPEAVGKLLLEKNMAHESIDHVLIAGLDSRSVAKTAASCGFDKAKVHQGFRELIGHAGSADALLLLADILQSAKAGELIMLISFGQGCDVLLFQATDLISKASLFNGVGLTVAQGIDDDNYLRFLSFNRLVDMDWGMRAERDNRTALSAFFRNRRAVTGFIGGVCKACGVAQFPKTDLCVNPICGKANSQEDEAFSVKRGEVKSFTEDWLALSLNPPLMYGSVRFDKKSTLMMEYADFSAGELSIGTPLKMVFRIKDFDELRGYRRYFWKAAPFRNLVD